MYRTIAIAAVLAVATTTGCSSTGGRRAAAEPVPATAPAPTASPTPTASAEPTGGPAPTVEAPADDWEDLGLEPPPTDNPFTAPGWLEAQPSEEPPPPLPKVMTAKQLGRELLDADWGISNRETRSATCKARKVDKRGVGVYRCTIRFLALDGSYLYRVDVRADGVWAGEPIN